MGEGEKALTEKARKDIYNTRRGRAGDFLNG